MPRSPRAHDLTYSVVATTPNEFHSRLDELITIHLRAMAYSESTRTQRTQLWSNSVRNPGFTSAVALRHPSSSSPNLLDHDQQIVGVAYGFTGDSRSWWYSQVFRGLLESGLPVDEAKHTLNGYAELAEIHVDPAFQGSGLGKDLLRDVLHRLPNNTVMLSTPEVLHENNSAWQLYRSFGFTDVLRNFTFTADPRPFGILQWHRDTGEGS